NGGGERDARAWGFDAVEARADAFDVGAVGENAPRVMLEAIPLLQKVVATVVADFQESLAVSDTDLGDVRGVNDQLAAVGQDRLQFVHALAAGPKSVIHRRGAGQNRVKCTALAR